MAEQNPTVIIAHLGDEKLRKSIDSLVGYVDEKFKAMTTSTTNAVNTMQNELQKLGSLNAKSASGAGGGELGITKALQRAKQEAKDSSVTFDKMSSSIQQAIAPKSAQDSYYTIIKNMRENVALLAMEIKSMPSSSLDKQFAVYMQYERQIEQVRTRISELNAEMQNLGKDPNSSRLVIKQTMDEIAVQKQKIVQLEREQLQATKQIESTDRQTLANKQQQYEKERKALSELVVGERERVTFQNSSLEKKKELATAEEQSAAKIKEEWELEQKLHQEQGKRYEAQNEINRQLEIENSKTAENLAFQEKINAVRASKEGGVGKRVRETNELTGAIAGLLGIQEREVAVTNVESASQHRLANYLNQLKTAYQRLDKEGMSASHGKMLADEIQRVSRAYAEMTKQMNRPTSLKNALGLDENTLDRMAYKMQQLNAYKMGLDITDPKQVAEMKRVEQEYDRLKKKTDELMGKNQLLLSSNNALARSWNYMKNRLAFYFTVGASTQFVKNLIEVRSQYEMNERALGILIDSAERGTQIFNELSQMALVSPYTLIELSSAAKQLTAYDVAAKDVVDTTRRLSDMAAAVGIPIERLTYALGQIKAYGYLNSRDARMFLNAGIPLVKNLADHYTELEGKMVSVGDVYDRMKKKAIGYNDVMQVITEMTDDGGKFFDFQAKMADTLKVQLANLTLAWNNMLNEIGKSEQGVLVGGIKGLKELFLQWKNIEKATLAFGISLGAVKAAQILYLIFGAKINKQLAVQAVLGQKAAHAFDGLGASLMKVATNPWTWVTVGVAMLAELAITAYQADEAIKTLNKSIIDAANERVESLNKTIANLNSQYNFEEFAPAEHMLSSDVSKDEAKKIWETIREEIEMSSSSAQEFINRLENIDDINVRVGRGFDYLKDIQKAQAALSQLDIKDIDVEQDMAGWWNLYSLQDGLIENFRDMQKEAGRAEKDWKDYAIRAAQGFKFGVLGAIIGGVGIKGSEGEHLKRYQEDLQTTVDSIITTMKKYNVEGANVQREFFATSMDKILQNTDLTEKERLKIRIDAQELFYQSEVESRQKAIARETGDYKNALQQELNDFIAFHEQRNGYTLGFEQWLQKTQLTMLTETFGKMSAEELKRIDFSKGEWLKWAYDISKKFAEQNNLAFDDVFSNLRKYLSQDFVLYIKTVLQKPDEKSLVEQLSSSDERLAKVNKDIERLNKVTKASKNYAKAQEEINKLEKERAELEKEDAIDDKKGKGSKQGGAKKDVFGEALAKEVQYISDIQKRFNEYQKMGVDAQQALTLATDEYGKSIIRNNAILQKYGVRTLSSEQLATMPLQEIRDFYKEQLNGAISSAKGVEALERAIANLNVEITKIDYKRITDGLNNELSKIKDEYELAVELDANPELGNIFTDMFGIDTTDFPKTIDEYMQRVQDEFDKGREKFNYQTPLNVFKATEEDWIRWGASVGIVTAKLDEQGNIMADDTDALDKFKAKFVEAQGVAKKWAQDTIKQTQDLQYKLADINGKIAIEQEKRERLRQQLAKETNEEQRRLLELQIKDQENAIKELQSQALVLMPEYKRVFGNIAEYSANVARKLQNDLRSVYDNAKYDPSTGKYELVGSDGKPVFLDEEQYTKEYNKLNKESQKTLSNFQKIKEAFKPSDKDGVVDYAKGIELVAEEARKAADGLHTVADIVEALGGSDDAVETLNDIATSMEGVSTAAQGFVQIQNKDYIGGAVNVIKGAWQAVSTWFDNSDKKISREIAASEMQVRKLELAYIDLEHEVEKAYGTMSIGAKQAAIANKELQLVELKRQLQLEESRKKKYRDEGLIRSLRGQIIELQNDIKKSYQEIATELLGISSIGDAAQNFMNEYVDALRKGEDAMLAFTGSYKEMIATMIKRLWVTKVVGPQLESVVDDLNKRLTERSKMEAEAYQKAVQRQTDLDAHGIGMSDSKIRRKIAEEKAKERMQSGEYYKKNYSDIFFTAWRETTIEEVENYKKTIMDEAAQNVIDTKRALDKAATPTIEDMDLVASSMTDLMPMLEDSDAVLKELLDRYDLWLDDADAKNKLSALQQGISSITEETAGALEAYMNGVSQQCYLQSDLLTQIRDAVVSIDSDVQIATNAQILLQLQQSYAVQMAIQSILMGWSTPSGMAVRVELNS